MSYRLLLDENVEWPLVYRLRNYGHDVEHVDELDVYGKGATDRTLATYSRDTDRLLLTYDNDFVLEIEQEEVRGVLFVSDDSMATDRVADAVDRMSEMYPQSEVSGVEYLDNWF